MKIENIFESPQADVDDARQTIDAYHAVAALTKGHAPDYEIEMSGERQYYGFDLTKLVSKFPFLTRTMLLLQTRRPNTIGMSGSMTAFKEPLDNKFDYALVVDGLKRFSEDAIDPLINSTSFLNVFRHECQHIIDNFNNKIVHGDKELNPNDRAEYFNDPAEFNAFTHDIAEPFTTIGQQSSDNAKDYAELYGFNGDVNHDIKTLFQRCEPIHQKFLSHLTPERRKALLRRLYKLHATYVGSVSV